MQIEEHLASPMTVGDLVKFKYGRHDKSGELLELTDNSISIFSESKRLTYFLDEISDLQKSTILIGINPMKRSETAFYNMQLSSLLFYFAKNSMEKGTRHYEFDNITWDSFNPFFGPFADGSVFHYQRPFEWELIDKQLLIESIYVGIDIDKFILRSRSCEFTKKHNTPDYEVVDGKQRILTILEFLNNKFPDRQGNYFQDFNTVAQRQFLGVQVLVAELQNVSDKKVQEQFVCVNYKGKRMSEEHLNLVKNFIL